MRQKNVTRFSQDTVNSKFDNDVFFLMSLHFSVFSSYLQPCILWKQMNPTMTRKTKKREDFTQSMISKHDTGNPRVSTPLNTGNTSRVRVISRILLINKLQLLLKSSDNQNTFQIRIQMLLMHHSFMTEFRNHVCFTHS